jgi:hypothetical protein
VLAALTACGYVPPLFIRARVDHDGDTSVLHALTNYILSLPKRSPAPGIHLVLESPLPETIPLVHPRLRSLCSVLRLLECASARGAPDITVEDSGLGHSLTPSRMSEQYNITHRPWPRTSTLGLIGVECLAGGPLWLWAYGALRQGSVTELTVNTRAPVSIVRYFLLHTRLPNLDTIDIHLEAMTPAGTRSFFMKHKKIKRGRMLIDAY